VAAATREAENLYSGLTGRSARDAANRQLTRDAQSRAELEAQQLLEENRLREAESLNVKVTEQKKKRAQAKSTSKSISPDAFSAIANSIARLGGS